MNSYGWFIVFIPLLELYRYLAEEITPRALNLQHRHTARAQTRNVPEKTSSRAVSNNLQPHGFLPSSWLATMLATSSSLLPRHSTLKLPMSLAQPSTRPSRRWPVMMSSVLDAANLEGQQSDEDRPDIDALLHLLESLPVQRETPAIMIPPRFRPTLLRPLAFLDRMAA